jgi:transketolase
MADQNVVNKLREQAFVLRKYLLKLCNQAMIHIGGDLSAADLMTVIWQYALKYDIKNPGWADRDRFVLSKGHASAVTNFSQAILGIYDIEEIFNEYATDYGRFGMHSCNLINKYVEVSTGSLGHGLPVSVGIAEAMRRKGVKSRVYVVMGDGENDEGSIWEGAMYASQLGLGNLIGFIDRNGLQLDAKTEDEVKLEPLADKWRAFGWNAIEVNGHDIAVLVDTVDNLPSSDSDKPTVVICNTVKGKNVSFMENQTSWHAGMIDTEFEMPLNLFKYLYANEITVSGFFISPYAFPRALQMLPKMQLDKFIVKSFPIDKSVEAFEAHLSGKYLKILIECNADLADK